MINDLLYDIENELGINRVKSIEKILDFIDITCFEEDSIIDDIDITIYTEKINCLQENICVCLEHDDFTVELLYENGINNGTRLNEYSINPTTSFTQETKTIEVFKDVEMDVRATCFYYESKKLIFDERKSLEIFEEYKSDITQLFKNRNYDNYVTGGGTCITDEYYKKKHRELNIKGIFWKVNYSEEEINSNFI